MSIAAAACCLAACTNAANDTPKAMQQVDFSHVLIKDAFWSPRLENNAKNTIPVCIDQIENQTGRIRNFEKAAIPKGPHSGIFFDDSDVYKAVEGMAYSLINNPDPALEAKADEGLRAIQRGPLVYCAEQIDNMEGFEVISISEGMEWNVVESPLMGGIRCLDSGNLRLIPYYSWDNRDACEMKVWLPYTI